MELAGSLSRLGKQIVQNQGIQQWNSSSLGPGQVTVPGLLAIAFHRLDSVSADI